MNGAGRYFARVFKKNRTFAAQSAVNDRCYNIFDKTEYEQYDETASRHTRI